MSAARLVGTDWNFWPDGLEVATIWRTCSELGFSGMELGVYTAAGELSPSRATEVAALSAETGMSVDAVLFSMPPERWPDGGLASAAASALAVAEITETARRSADLGASVLGVWPGADLVPSADGWARTIEAVGAVADGVAGLGLTVAVEYKPGQVVASADDALRLCAEVDRPAVGVLVDTAHALAGGEDLAFLPGLLGDRLVHVHLGDSGGDADADLPPGVVHDFAPFLAGLAANAYPGVLSFDLYGCVASGAFTGRAATEAGLAHVRAAMAEAR